MKTKNKRSIFRLHHLAIFIFLIAKVLFCESISIDALVTNGNFLWVKGQKNPARVNSGDLITLYGEGFGSGPDIDFSKILIGKARLLERDLEMYEGAINIQERSFYEKPNVFDHWKKDIVDWNDKKIEFRIPGYAIEGPLVVQVQKRVGKNRSLKDKSNFHWVLDPLTERILDPFPHVKDAVYQLSVPAQSQAVPLDVTNSKFEKMVERGEATFWNYDFNIGLVHKMSGLDWSRTFSGKAVDPIKLIYASPELFGAIRMKKGEVPKVALSDYYFDPFPIPIPIKPLLGSPLLSGGASPTGFAGFVYAESIHPISHVKGKWIGFSCVSCHGQKITYEDPSGKTVSRIFPGLPNPDWSMKWSVLGELRGVKGNETNRDGEECYVDKTRLLYSVPNGTGEHTLVRSGEEDSIYRNDGLFSPIAIPIITRHTPVRRALSRTELIAGFEGSYIHSEEPDGAIGALLKEPLQDLTAFMTTLDRDDVLLERIGLYRWLKKKGELRDVNNVKEGEFIKVGKESFNSLMERIKRGKNSFDSACIKCHQPNFGTWSDEQMMPIDEVGTYFSPTLFHMQTQSIRTAIIRNLFWVEKRGLLHDGHVKSLEDLVHPERCDENSSLYRHYYTLHQGTFKIEKGEEASERALRNHAYFVDVAWDKKHLYWDYQKMRSEFGPKEVGSKGSLPLPKTPHPWCVKDPSEVDELVLFLLTL